MDWSHPSSFEAVSQATLADPGRLNLYAFALNNPMGFTDPDGKAPVPTLLDQPQKGTLFSVKVVSDGNQ